jgi:hypothetical protein
MDTIHASIYYRPTVVVVVVVVVVVILHEVSNMPGNNMKKKHSILEICFLWRNERKNKEINKK